MVDFQNEFTGWLDNPIDDVAILGKNPIINESKIK